jgi:hypothetical protein
MERPSSWLQPPWQAVAAAKTFAGFGARLLNRRWSAPYLPIRHTRILGAIMGMVSPEQQGSQARRRVEM